MLSRKENLWNLWTIKILSIFNVLPFDINVQSGKIQIQSSDWTLLLWKGQFSLSILHSAYLTFRLVESLLIPDLFLLQHFVVNFMGVIAMYTFYFWNFLLGVLRPVELIKIFNEQSRAKGGWNIKSSRQILSYSRLELVTAIFPFMMFEVFIMCVVLYVSDRGRMIYIYAALPSDWQTSVGFWILFPLEMIFMLSYLGMDYFGVIVQMLFFLKTESTFSLLRIQAQKLTIKSGNSDQSYQRFLDKMQRLSLFIHLFNNCFCYVIFSYKMFCLTIGIFCGYFGIRLVLSSSHVILGLICATFCFDSVLVFSVIYEKAFFIVENMKGLKKEVKLGASQFHVPFIRKLIGRRLTGIPIVGVRVGNFHILERISTPIFIHFVLTNIVTLLLTIEM